MNQPVSFSKGKLNYDSDEKYIVISEIDLGEIYLFKMLLSSSSGTIICVRTGWYDITGNNITRTKIDLGSSDEPIRKYDIVTYNKKYYQYALDSIS